MADRFADGGGLTRSGNEYTQAVQIIRPRSLSMVANRCVEEAQLGGDLMFYEWGKGQDRILGPSKELAFTLARVWGNCAVDFRPVQETADAHIFTAVFVDLETGFTMSRQFRQAKDWRVHGRLDEARKDDIRFQMGQTKAARNVILAAMPAAIVQRMMEAAQASATKQLAEMIGKEGLPAVRERALKKLKTFGVSEKQVLERFALGKVGEIQPSHLEILVANIRAIERREVEVSDIFAEVPAAAGGVTQAPVVAPPPDLPEPNQTTEGEPTPAAHTDQADPKPPVAAPAPASAASLFPPEVTRKNRQIDPK